MRVIEARAEVLWEQTSEEILSKLERAGRTAYRSEGLIGPGTAKRFVEKLLGREHLSVLEHVSVSARVVTSVIVSRELVRHRIAAYTMESTRYCNYSGDKFGNEITVVRPSWLHPQDVFRFIAWRRCILQAEEGYFELLRAGCKPEEAREVLPFSLAAETTLTFNLREWLHFFTMRTSKKANPEMRAMAQALLAEFHAKLPEIFPAKMPEVTFTELLRAVHTVRKLISNAKEIWAKTVGLEELLNALPFEDDLGE